MKPYRSFSVGPPKAWRRQNSLTSTIHYSTEYRAQKEHTQHWQTSSLWVIAKELIKEYIHICCGCSKSMPLLLQLSKIWLVPCKNKSGVHVAQWWCAVIWESAIPHVQWKEAFDSSCLSHSVLQINGIECNRGKTSLSGNILKATAHRNNKSDCK